MSGKLHATGCTSLRRRSSLLMNAPQGDDRIDKIKERGLAVPILSPFLLLEQMSP